MNINQIIEKIKSNKTLQIISAIVIFLIIFLIIRSFFFSQKNVEAPCFKATLKIWSPFKKENFYSLISELSQYCLNFEFVEKSLEEIESDLIYALASNDFPDIVYIDNSYFFKNKDFFAMPTPVNIDGLVAYYNKDVLNFLQLEKPRTLNEFKDFIQKINEFKKKDFTAVGLGTINVKNRKEIILTFMTLNPNYNDLKNFRQNFLSALQFYRLFQDPQSEFFANQLISNDDLTNFAQEKSAMYIGFYKDKEEIFKLNPRLNYEISSLPNTFPPKMKFYSQVFYLAPIKKSKKIEVALAVLDYFSNYKIKNFVETFDLVPFDETAAIDENKKIVSNIVKNFGETFDFLNKEVIFSNIDKILDSWDNRYLILEEIINSL